MTEDNENIILEKQVTGGFDPWRFRSMDVSNGFGQYSYRPMEVAAYNLIFRGYIG